MCSQDYIIQILVLLNKAEDELTQEEFLKLREKIQNILENYR